MYFQVSVKDFQNAIRRMTSNHATVVCCKNPQIFASMVFEVNDDGEIVIGSSYQVDRTSVCLGRNVPIKTLVEKFNEAIRSYVESTDEVITLNSMLG